MMFVKEQKRRALVNMDQAASVCVRAGAMEDHRIFQICEFDTATYECTVLGEYDTREEADSAFDALMSAITTGQLLFEMPLTRARVDQERQKAKQVVRQWKAEIREAHKQVEELEAELEKFESPTSLEWLSVKTDLKLATEKLMELESW